MSKLRGTGRLAMGRVAFVALLLLLNGCHAGMKTGVCEPVVGANSVVVELPQDANGKAQQRVITNLEQVERLVQFANARRDVWQPRLYAMPSPEITAFFYQNGTYLGAFGVGRNFFYASGPKWSGIRDAKKDEIREFKRLIGVR